MIVYQQLFGNKSSFESVKTVFTPNSPGKVQIAAKYLKAPNCKKETLFDFEYNVVYLL